MKSFIQLTLAVTLAATASASSHHGHRHLHAKKDATKVDKREPDVVTKIVAGPTQVVYLLGDDFVDPADAEKGLADGEFVVVGQSTPTFTPPPAPTTTKDLGGQFIESKSTTTTPPPPPPTTTSTPPPPPPSSTAAAPVANAAASTDNSSSSSGGGGEDSEFPSGTIECGSFPSKYGAIPLPWLELGGWMGVQRVPNYVPGALDISYIETAIPGEGCTANSMCTYSCKPGYQPSQWPAAQGNTGQSIGGVYCNANGYLELSRPSVKQLCTAGEGSVSVKNDLDEIMSLCRTDYPGPESMVNPTAPQPGQTLPLTNPSQSGYYQWKKMKTSAQYYINNKGVTPEEGCRWTCATNPEGCGNWAPMIAGVGKADDGITYMSLFFNLPTSHAMPDYNVEIIGGSTKCAYENGAWSAGGTGCTVGIAPGQEGTIRFY